MNKWIERIRQIFDDMNKLRSEDYYYYGFKGNLSSILEEINGLIAEVQDGKRKCTINVLIQLHLIRTTKRLSILNIIRI